MQQICETIVKIKSLKDLSKQSDVIQEASVQEEADQLEKAAEEGQAEQKKSEIKDAKDFYNSEGFLSELQLYSPITLNGTLLKHFNTH